MTDEKPQNPVAIAINEAGSFGLQGWLKMVGNLTAMTLIAGIACWLLYVIIGDLRGEVRDLHRKLDEQRELLRDIQRDTAEVRREHQREPPWYRKLTSTQP